MMNRNKLFDKVISHSDRHIFGYHVDKNSGIEFEIDVEFEEFYGYGERFYIMVTNTENGMRSYDGYASEEINTIEEAVKEAFNGAMIK